MKKSIEAAMFEVKCKHDEELERIIDEKMQAGDLEGCSEYLDQMITFAGADLARIEGLAGQNNVGNALLAVKNNSILYADEKIILRPIVDHNLARVYSDIRKASPITKDFFGDSLRGDMFLGEALDESSFYCIISDSTSGEAVGYCGVASVYADELEISIELYEKFFHHGYGYRAVEAYLAACRDAGANHFIASVFADNVASIGLFKKLGFKPLRLGNYMVYDEELLERIEAENMELIDNQIIALAEEFAVEPSQLLSHTLVFGIDL